MLDLDWPTLHMILICLYCRRTFVMELEVAGKHSKRLKWRAYSIRMRVPPYDVTELAVNSEHYRPFFFSRVKSYMASSTGRLE